MRPLPRLASTATSALKRWTSSDASRVMQAMCAGTTPSSQRAWRVWRSSYVQSMGVLRQVQDPGTCPEAGTTLAPGAHPPPGGLHQASSRQLWPRPASGRTLRRAGICLPGLDCIWGDSKRRLESPASIANGELSTPRPA
eukprot:5095277-Amphidinium_carterae.1